MLKHNFIVICLLALLFGIVACSGIVTPTAIPTLIATAKPALFVYQVHVQTKEGIDLANAETSIEVSGLAALVEVTDVNGGARFFIDSIQENHPARLFIEAQGYEKHAQSINLIKDALPLIVQLKAEPTPLALPSATTIQSVATATIMSLTAMPAITPTFSTPEAVFTFNVSTDLLTTNACYAPGNKILVTAKGNISLGESIGSTNADGKDSFDKFGLTIPIDKQYYIDRDYPLGALMCKLGDDESDWLLCGTSKLWNIDATGCVNFLVNDKITDNNSGAYTVTIETLK